VKFTTKDPCKRSLARPFQGFFLGPASMVLLGLIILTCGFPAVAQSQQQPAPMGMESALPDMPVPSAGESAGEDPDQRVPGSISGTIVDRNGAAVAGARVVLAREGQTPVQEVLSGDDGRFSFANVSPGPFRLTITAEGFAAQAASGVLHAGESYTEPQITLAVATAVTEVRVEFSPIELAQEQLKDQEKQRILAVIPNFYISYVPDAAPLTSKQKFELAWKTMVDPVTFGVNAAIAGIQQSQNDFSGYGQGAQGYAKRYGALYADFATSTLIGNAVLPSLLKQDPRYFYKGSGSVRSRLYYAIANAVICKGDNGRWQANYSAILGSLAAGGISNLYYPESDRHGAALTFENTLIGIGATAGVNVLQEFVLKRLTSNVPNGPGNNSATP
jgi:hypothetical protein